MPNVIQTNISAGQVGQRIRGRIDNPKYLNGVDELENFLPFVQGGVARRPGLSRVEDSVASFLTNSNHRLEGLNIPALVAPTTPAAWVTTTGYSIGDWVLEGSLKYVCLVAHTSGTFATDLAAGKWELEGTTDTSYYFLEVAKNTIRVIRGDNSAVSASGVHAVTDPSKLIQSIVTTYADEEIPELRIVPIGVDQIYITHANHKPAILTVGSPPSSATWSLDNISFTCEPFVKLDTTDTELKIVNESELIAIESDVNESWASLPNLATNVRYIEYRVKNEWFLGRIVDSNVDVSYPDPTNTKIYVDPVEAVLTGLDQSARMVHTDDTDDDTATGIHEFRSDTLIWNYDYVGAWVRIVSEFDDLRNTGFADGNVYWGKISKYEGEKDIPTKFLDNPTVDEFDVGSIYKITQQNSGTAEQYRVSAPIDKSLGAWPTSIDWTNGFLYDTVGDQFSWQNNARIETAGVTGNVLLDNLSSLKTFDVVELNNTTAEPVLSTSATYITGASANLIQATGNLTIMDADTDPDGNAHHTCNVQVMRGSTFSAADVGRYLQLQLSSDWVTVKITAYTAASAPTPEYVTCDIIGSIPRDTNSSEFVNEGQTSIWRKSVWGTGDYPHTVTFYEQRLIFGGSPTYPNYFWASKIEDNFDFRIIEDDGQVLDTTGITYPLSSTDLSSIVWMVPGPSLVIGTTQKEWQVKPNSFGKALTQTNIRITSETEIGSDNKAIRAGSSIFFVERGARGFREMYFDFSVDGFRTRDLFTLADDILKEETIRDFAYQKFPNSIFWIVTSAGRLISFTYDSENNFYAFADHGGNNRVSVGTAPRTEANNAEDALWVGVNSGGTLVGYGQILQLGPVFRKPSSEDGYKGTINCLDISWGISEANGDTVASVTGLTGLDWLDGFIVDIVIDGVYHGTDQVDAFGALTLPVTAEKNILIGQAYTSKLKTLPHASAGAAGPNWGRLKRFRKVFAYLLDSLGGTVADESGSDVDIQYLTSALIHGQSPDLFTGFKDLDYNWTSGDDPRVIIKNSSPYPMTILSLGFELESND